LRAPGQRHVLAPGGPPRLLERGPDTLRDEGEGGSPFELEGLARVVREHENGVVERRGGSPPPRAPGRGRAAPPAAGRHAPSPHQPFHGFRASQPPGWPPNMFRPITVAPTLASDSSTTRVLSSTSPPGRPCIALQAARGKTHSCRRIPPIPIGSSTLWLGPATKPSSDIEILKRSLDKI